MINNFIISASGLLSNDDIEEICYNFNASMNMLGVDNNHKNEVFSILACMIDEVKVNNETLRGKLGEKIPGCFCILAKSLGITDPELNDLIRKEKIITSNVILGFSKEVSKCYGLNV